MPKTTLLDRKAGLYLKDTATKGRGLFRNKAIKAGEIIELTPAIVLGDKANDDISETILNDYVFTLGGISKKLRQIAKVKRLENSSCVVMGIASYANHDDDNPNAEILWEETGGSLYYMLSATKDIPKNTEICTSYGDGWFEDR